MKTQTKIFITLLLIFLGGLSLVQSQDIHFSQFTMTPLLVNPAQTGSQNDLRAVMNYKNQWSSVSQPYNTYNFSFDVSLKKKKNISGFSAMGLNIFNDKAGNSKMGTLFGNLTYAYHVFLSDRSTLGGGIYAAIGQRSTNTNNLQWGNQYDGMAYNSNLPTGEPVSNNLTFFDIGGGVHWKYNKNEKYMTGNDQRYYNAGIAVFHVNQPKYSFYDTGEKLYMKEVAYANALIGISSTKFSIVPGIIYSMQGKANELLLGSLIRYQLKESSKFTSFVKGASISPGLYYRNRDAAIVCILFEFSQYSLGISYDVNLSKLKTASKGKGGIEISLSFVSPNPFTGRSTTKSPRFFN